jgi:hypothetical protein
MCLIPETVATLSPLKYHSENRIGQYIFFLSNNLKIEIKRNSKLGCDNSYFTWFIPLLSNGRDDDYNLSHPNEPNLQNNYLYE